MKVTHDFLKKLIIDEVSKIKFGPIVSTSDVEAEETPACDLADSLENHEDFAKNLKKKIAIVEVLSAREKELVEQLKKIRKSKNRIARELEGVK